MEPSRPTPIVPRTRRPRTLLDETDSDDQTLSRRPRYRPGRPGLVSRPPIAKSASRLIPKPTPEQPSPRNSLMASTARAGPRRGKTPIIKEEVVAEPSPVPAALASNVPFQPPSSRMPLRIEPDKTTATQTNPPTSQPSTSAHPPVCETDAGPSTCPPSGETGAAPSHSKSSQ
ncbi:vegetative cell wall protein gp1-like [Zingiber officinale]|uniref:vegetative cell wall protein gp1-like n=1 Tax=Zingiber officinale TaxID=94328 RepID=UPI001C4DD277|nr:vegetative cell wall protein gp1-like [Zingiber officinale]